MSGRGGCGWSGVPLAAGAALAVVPDAGLRAGRRLARRGRTLPPLPPGQRLRGTEGQRVDILQLFWKLLWIRIRIWIRIDQYQIERYHRRIRNCIKVIKWIRIRINLQMTSQIVWKMSLFDHFIKVLSFEPLFGS